ncbi:hypothetical protein, partial [Kosakonia radicincitans]|uniref:hypothetical protein n=1 Tax=Kosakonia radicincitans TaxID=283686 RepID=UPI0023686411
NGPQGESKDESSSRMHHLSAKFHSCSTSSTSSEKTYSANPLPVKASQLSLASSDKKRCLR